MLIDVEKIKKLQSKLITEEITSLEFLSQSVSAVERHVADLIFLNPPLKKNHQIVELVPIHHKLCEYNWFIFILRTFIRYTTV